ncbi:MAG: XdhC family protein [Gemmatimonadaceae bacterium]
MPDLAILAQCARVAAAGGIGALATVARRSGSLPMSATAKMLVTTRGERIGTVGGGCLEAEITERALEVAEMRHPVISAHTLNSELAGDYGLTCGGTAVMFIEPVFGDPALTAVYQAGVTALARGERAIVATDADWSEGIRKALFAGGSATGSASEAMQTAASSLDPRAELPLLTGRVLVEPLVGRPRLVVFGGGHVGARVADAAAFAGWRVTVVDDRAEFADPARHPAAESTVACAFHDLPASLGIGADTYVVVATRGHQHDAVVVEQIARTPTRYLGMLGSRRKVALTWKLLEEQGIPRERLDEIHAPVGLSIGADTPEEIAISIVAELVAIRRQGSRRRGGFDLRETAPPK